MFSLHDVRKSSGHRACLRFFIMGAFMNIKNLLFLGGLMVGSSACMGQTRPAPDTSPLPDVASITDLSAVEARRLEAERRSGVIFETSRPGKFLVDGQVPVEKSSSEKTGKPEKELEEKPDVMPVEPSEPAQQEYSAEDEPGTDPAPSESDD